MKKRLSFGKNTHFVPVLVLKSVVVTTEMTSRVFRLGQAVGLFSNTNAKALQFIRIENKIPSILSSGAHLHAFYTRRGAVAHFSHYSSEPIEKNTIYSTVVLLLHLKI